ncbi:hypothetical protein WJR50_19480 [Catalinimonas sp. 4WD22]|uniref:hypothetical protein n=1 Tax=Catalinimonas locisalis TaxID=3133978 RepID=UPI003100C972
MKQITYLIIINLLIMSCQPSSSETDEKYARAQEIYQEAIAVHDEVMPRMDEIMRLKSLLNERIEGLQQKGEEINTDSLQHMQEIVQKLEEADEAMMQWMRNVKQVPEVEKEPSADAETARLSDTTNLIQVQQEQKAAIEHVKTQMESSIKEARTFLVLPE